MLQRVIIWMTVFILYFLPYYLTQLRTCFHSFGGFEFWLFFYPPLSPPPFPPFSGVSVGSCKGCFHIWDFKGLITEMIKCFSHQTIRSLSFSFTCRHAHISVSCCPHVVSHPSETKWKRTVYWFWQCCANTVRLLLVSEVSKIYLS